MEPEPRRLLIFDLDETLVHASEFALAHPCNFEVGPYLVYSGPFACELIESAAARFAGHRLTIPVRCDWNVKSGYHHGLGACTFINIALTSPV